MELEAQGSAASIREDGEAQIGVFTRLAEEFAAAGPNARDVLVLKMLPDLVETITRTIDNIDIDRLTVIDGGGEGGGGGLPGIAKQMPGAVIAIAEQIEAATGVDIMQVLRRPAEVGDGRGSGSEERGSARTVELDEGASTS